MADLDGITEQNVLLTNNTIMCLAQESEEIHSPVANQLQHENRALSNQDVGASIPLTDVDKPEEIATNRNVNQGNNTLDSRKLIQDGENEFKILMISEEWVDHNTNGNKQMNVEVISGVTEFTPLVTQLFDMDSEGTEIVEIHQPVKSNGIRNKPDAIVGEGSELDISKEDDVVSRASTFVHVDDYIKDLRAIENSDDLDVNNVLLKDFLRDYHYQYIESLSLLIQKGESKCKLCTIMVLIMKKENKGSVISDFNKEHDESVLHLAATFHDCRTLFEALLGLDPRMALQKRWDTGKLFLGLTPLHVLVSRGCADAVDSFLNNLPESVKEQALNAVAKGKRFYGTCILGETVLSTAALGFHTSIVKLLLENGVDMLQINSRGNTVLHSLAQYTLLHPECRGQAIEMMAELQAHILSQRADVTRKHQKVNAARVSSDISNGNNNRSRSKQSGSIVENERIEDHCSNSNVQINSSMDCIGDGEEICKENDANNWCRVYARHVWFKENFSGYTALQMAAITGQSEIVKFILELQWVYRTLHDYDGVFKTNKYDITEIDTLAKIEWCKEREANTVSQVESKKTQLVSKAKRLIFCQDSVKALQSTPAILESICAIDVDSACNIISLPVVQKLIRAKWQAYKIWFYIWLFCFFAELIFLSFYASFKTRYITYLSQQHIDQSLDHGSFTYNMSTENGSATQRLRFTHDSPEDKPTWSEKAFVDFGCFQAFFVSVGAIYLEFVRTCIQRKPWHLRVMHHNGVYRLMLLVRSVILVVDSLWFLSSPRTNSKFPLVTALLLSWWFTTFFLRPFKKFSFFTVMLMRVIVGDMLRFFTIILIALISFTMSMHLLFMNSSDLPEGFESLPLGFLTMFKLMLGLTDLTILEKADPTWLAVTLFVIYILITYVLLINSLIAMMSSTCHLIAGQKANQWTIQRLSVILYLEGMMICELTRRPWKRNYFRRHDDKVEPRYILEDLEYADGTDNEPQSMQAMSRLLRTVSKTESCMRTNMEFDRSLINEDSEAGEENSLVDTFVMQIGNEKKNVCKDRHRQVKSPTDSLENMNSSILKEHDSSSSHDNQVSSLKFQTLRGKSVDPNEFNQVGVVSDTPVSIHNSQSERRVSQRMLTENTENLHLNGDKSFPMVRSPEQDQSKKLPQKPLSSDVLKVSSAAAVQPIASIVTSNCKQFIPSDKSQNEQDPSPKPWRVSDPSNISMNQITQMEGHRRSKEMDTRLFDDCEEETTAYCKPEQHETRMKTIPGMLMEEPEKIFEAYSTNVSENLKRQKQSSSQSNIHGMLVEEQQKAYKTRPRIRVRSSEVETRDWKRKRDAYIKGLGPSYDELNFGPKQE